jgi:outer membrane protein insertion porin family
MRLTFNKTNFRFFCAISLLLAFMSSCSETKRVTGYQQNRPFVYDNKISLHGNLTKDEKNRLTTELVNYWDDSLQSRRVNQWLISYKIKNPPVFDSNNINRTINFMNAYLNSQGYYYATFLDSVRIDTLEDQLRTHVGMTINIGKRITIDSVSYDLDDTTLQTLTNRDTAKTLLKKGTPYTKQIISKELDRLVGIYRDSGYYRFTRDDIYAYVDSTDPRLLELTLDPFKQAQIIVEADKLRRENPTWDITVLKRPTFDSSKLTQYHIGRIYYYPETRLSDEVDSLPNHTGFQEFKRRNLTMRYKKGLFNYRVFREHTYLRNGDLYNESNYYKTLNALGQIGAWQQVDGRPVVRDNDTLDLHLFLVPAVKQNYSIDLEGSRNTGDNIGYGNNWGLSTNLTYNNKNVWKSAIQSFANFRTGVELNLLSNTQPLLQTFLINVGHTYAFPRLIQPFKNWRALNRMDNKRTLFNVGASYVDRKDFYQLRSVVTSWGYEWKKKNNIWLYKPINVEFYVVDTLAGLDTLFARNPFLINSFNSGKVLSQNLSLLRSFADKKNPRKTHFMRFGIEEAGGLFGLVPGWQDKIYRFIKFEAEYRQSVKFPRTKTELAYRAFAGFGYNYGNDTARDKTLPFFKQFSAGGPYSMRAWALRQLGLGSSTQGDSDTSENAYRDRYGDMELEVNIEYRFPLATIAGVKIGSALYADIGNVWAVKNNPADPDATFHLKNLARDLAIGVGTGVRVDFSYFILRMDVAYKLKDPARQYNNGWANTFQWFENRPNGVKVQNMVFQLGIGLPF